MARLGAVLILASAFFSAGVVADGELDVIHAPSSLKWTGHTRLQESLLKEVYSASMGLSVEESSNWSGLAISDPFNTPEAIVEVYIDGVASLGNAGHVKWQRYPLALDEYSLDTFPTLNHRIRQRYADSGNNLVNIALDDQADLNEYSAIFGKIKISSGSKRTLQQLKPKEQEEDAAFLQELDVLRAITDKVESGAVSADNVLDFYHLRFGSLHPLCDLHGVDSLEAKEAKRLLAEALEELSEAFVKAYDGSVLVTAVSSDASHTRRVARSLMQAQEKPDTKQEKQESKRNTKVDFNLAPFYSADYPAIFNILLWFGVVFVFSLLAIVYALADMDPGRDSIIYRMTSNRMKKDN